MILLSPPGLGELYFVLGFFFFLRSLVLLQLLSTDGDCAFDIFLSNAFVNVELKGGFG
jgi:hypothetical protein